MNDQSYAAALRESLAAREEKKPCCRRSYAAGLAGEPPPDFACAGDAGCYLRGVRVIQIPTTLLAMIGLPQPSEMTGESLLA